jgi:MFS family permease
VNEEKDDLVEEAASKARHRRWLTPGVKGIGVASFLSDLGHEVVTSLFPRFVTSSLGGSAASLGIIEGIADALAGVARLGGGALADDPDRRRAVALGGYTSTAVLSSAIGVAQAVWQVAFLRGGAWAARGLRVPSRNALLADAVSPECYGRAYGFERMADNLGAIGGPLLALGLVTIFSVRTAMLLSVVPGLLAAVAILYAIRHIPRLTAKERQKIRLRVMPVMRGRLGKLMWSISAFEMGNVAATLLILRATQLLRPAHGLASATEIGILLYLCYNVSATVFSLPAGHVIDRLGANVMFGTGAAAFLAAYVLFALSGPSISILLLAFICAGVGIACAETAQSAAVASAAPFHLRGSAFGLLAAVQSFGNLAASAVAGVIWTVVSPEAAFTYLGAWMLLALVALTMLQRDSQSAASEA